ncbi:DUF3696 domain-containing protein [Actinomadura madurae]|uniref:DUF3696 domain-containing protein n=1 Tax=Actinomadura madurae TaxID=1993 RepID=UPI000D96F648|nr:DUF3696 domain-containing protein [Actinomadura madurae]SPT60102.1 Uncharacterized conserved protein [Actinomadura madurae]
MITRLTIENFKAFAWADVPLSSYTVLSGLNSSGKSTVIQALALLRQAEQSRLLRGVGITGLPLNGELVELGTGQDVLHEDYVTRQRDEGPEIGFFIETRTSARAGQSMMVKAGYGPEDDLLRITTFEMLPTGGPWSMNDFGVFHPNFQYLRADRISPAVAYPRSHEMAVRRGFLGTRGEYTIDFLRHNQDTEVRSPLLHDPESSPLLLDQVEAWMREICPGVKILTAAIDRTDLVRLGFEFTRPGQLTSNSRQPTNVGFGLTYVLPVVVACLTAQPGAMILIENPESHVHPQGQSALARLTCAAAAAGAQVIVETHSDHILNGVRLAVKRAELPADDVRLLYFHRQDDGIIDIVNPTIGPDGMLSDWPQGFFDEWDRSLDQLLD